MKSAHTSSISLSQSGVVDITIEVVIRPGLPTIEVTGATRRVSEGVTRLTSAVRASGYTWPKGKVYIHIAPQPALDADCLDLAVAIAVLAADGQIRPPTDQIVLGNVSLTGDVHSFKHSKILLSWCRDRQLRLLTSFTLKETWKSVGTGVASLITNLKDIPYSSLCDANPTQSPPPPSTYAIDKVIGHRHAKRALAVALVGRLPLLLTGASGIGKTVLVESAAELLPQLLPEEETERLVAYALAGLEAPAFPVPSVVTAAFPCTAAQLSSKLGGLPGGYLALSKTGVLFIDELGERGRDIVDSLRHILDVSHGTPRYNQCLIAAQNTCYCGRYGDHSGRCTCSAADLAKYQRIFSEALYQRFPLSLYLERSDNREESSTGQSLAAQIAYALLKSNQPTLLETARDLVETAAVRSRLSNRCTDNILRVGAAIARLDAKEAVDEACIQEALTYRYRPTSI